MNTFFPYLSLLYKHDPPANAIREDRLFTVKTRRLMTLCSSLSSLRHERAQAVCGQRAKPVWNGPHRASRSPLPQDRGQHGQATRHRLVSGSAGVCGSGLCGTWGCLVSEWREQQAPWCDCEWLIFRPLRKISGFIHIFGLLWVASICVMNYSEKCIYSASSQTLTVAVTQSFAEGRLQGFWGTISEEPAPLLC